MGKLRAHDADDVMKRVGAKAETQLEDELSQEKHLDEDVSKDGLSIA